MSSTGGKEDFSFDEIAKHFHLPIMEAATKLGICSTILKKVIKEHGIPRWPYRKMLSGTSLEEIKAKAMINLQKMRSDSSPLAYQAQQPQSMDSSPKPHGLPPAMESRTVPPLRGVPPPPTLHMLAFKPNAPSDHPFPYPVPPLNAKKHLPPEPKRTGPTSFLDDFNLGYPSTGLRKEENKWWGVKRKRDENEKEDVCASVSVKENKSHLKDHADSHADSDASVPSTKPSDSLPRNDSGNEIRIQGAAEIHKSGLKKNKPNEGAELVTSERNQPVANFYEPSTHYESSACSLLRMSRDKLAKKSDLDLLSLKFGREPKKEDQLILRYLFGDTLYSCAFHSSMSSNT